jgi:hypothetical protein
MIQREVQKIDRNINMIEERVSLLEDEWNTKVDGLRKLEDERTKLDSCEELYKAELQDIMGALRTTAYSIESQSGPPNK